MAKHLISSNATIKAIKTAVDAEDVTILRLAYGKCVERWSQTDVLGIMRQIGAAP